MYEEYEEEQVLCAASAYTRQYYFNPQFEAIPEQVREELQIRCVLFTEEVGGALVLWYDEDGGLQFDAFASEEDLMYDEIGSGLKVKELRQEHEALFRSLETFYRVVFLGEEEE